MATSGSDLLGGAGGSGGNKLTTPLEVSEKTREFLGGEGQSGGGVGVLLGGEPGWSPTGLRGLTGWCHRRRGESQTEGRFLTPDWGRLG